MSCLAPRGEPGDDFFVDVFELRRLIEPAAAGLAAGRAAPAEIEELETALADMETAVDDRDAYLAADLRFHTVILEASHNELLARTSAEPFAPCSARASPERCRLLGRRSASTRPSPRPSA